MSIHPTAIIDPAAQIADDAEVQAFSIIGAHVCIGSGTIVGPHCVVDGRTDIGKNNHFFSGTQLGVISQDLKHRPELVGRLVIGDGNVFREHVTVSASTIEGSDDDHRVTTIGDNGFFMACSHIGHDCQVGDSAIMANSAALAGHVVIEDNVTIGGLSGVHQECMVGRMAFIGGMTRLPKDVPPYMIIEGNPARCAGPNIVGLRRKDYDDAARARIKAMYKALYRSKLNTTQALLKIEETVEESPERTYFTEFVRKSIRGIIK